MNDLLEINNKDKEVGAKLIQSLRLVLNYLESDRKSYRTKDAKLDDFTNKKILNVEDIQELFGVGIVKAYKIMNAVPHFSVGHKHMCTRLDLYNTITSNKLKLKW